MEKNVVVINKKIASNTKVIEVSGDIIVPDIKPDIVSVINTNANSYIYKEDVSEGRVRVDGNIDTYIVYLADNGENRSIQTTLNFVENIEDSNITASNFSKQKVCIENIEAKVLNERKLSIKANLKIKSEVFENTQIEIASDFDEIQEAQKLKETVEIKSVIGMNKVKTSIKEDVAVDSSFEVAEILKTSVEVSNFENKISYNKVLAKADANVKIIFLSEDGRIGACETSIPVMSFIDIESVTDTNICNVEYNVRNMLFKPNSKEMHSISCQVDFEVSCEAYESKTVEVIQDMYGIKNNIEFSKKDVEVEINGICPEEKVSLNESVLVEDVMNILDVNCMPRVVTSSKSGNFYNYECELNMDFYYEADNRNGLNVKNIKLPFIVKFEGSQGEVEFNITRKQFTIRDENVDLDIEILVKQASVNMKQISIIENVETKNLEEESDYKMFLYFVKAGDTIWNIAKRFRVSMNDIIKLNELENPDRINVGDRLYIMR
jgi:hypothetical protein